MCCSGVSCRAKTSHIKQLKPEEEGLGRYPEALSPYIAPNQSHYPSI